MEKLWTTEEVAEFLNIGDADVEALVREGRLTGYKLGGQFLRFRPDQVKGLKGTIQFRPAQSTPAAPRETWWASAKEFVYFHDFYVVSATLLAALAVYLIVAG